MARSAQAAGQQAAPAKTGAEKADQGELDKLKGDSLC